METPPQQSAAERREERVSHILAQLLDGRAVREIAANEGLSLRRRGLAGPGHGICDGRRRDRQGSPPRAGRKKGAQNQAIGRSKGGMTTKILALTDALGQPRAFRAPAGPSLRYRRRRPAHQGHRVSRSGRRQSPPATPSFPIRTNARRRSSSRNIRAARNQSVQMAASDREFLLQTQGIQAHRHAQRQDKSELRRYGLSLTRRHKLPMNPNGP